MKLNKVVTLLLLLTNVMLPQGYATSTGTCNDTDNALMLHFNGTDASTTFTDSSTNVHTQTAVGNAQLDTAQQQFGSASLLLDGSGDYVTSSHDSSFDYGTGDFTIDFWVRFNSTGSGQYLFTRDTGSIQNGLDLLWSTDNTITLYMGNSTIMNRTFSVSTATWYHVAVVRTGSTMKIFKDGVQAGADGTASTNINYNTTTNIGAFDFAGGLSPFNGWIDEFRITKGTAVWTANFTPPSAEYADTCTATRRRVFGTTID